MLCSSNMRREDQHVSPVPGVCLGYEMGEYFVSLRLSGVQTNRTCKLFFMSYDWEPLPHSHSCLCSSLDTEGERLLSKPRCHVIGHYRDGERRIVFSSWLLRCRAMAGLDSSCYCRLLSLSLFQVLCSFLHWSAWTYFVILSYHWYCTFAYLNHCGHGGKQGLWQSYTLF